MRNDGHLLRVLGLVFGLAAVVGSVVGQGILRSPGVVAEASPSPWVILGLWILGAAITAISAMPHAELGSAIPNAGGGYAFAVRAFGERIGVGVGYAMLIAMITTVAQVAFVVGEFLFRAGVGAGRIAPGLLGIATLALFCVINAAGTRVSGSSQIVLSSFKGAFLLALVVVFFAQPGAEIAREPVEAGAGWFAMVTAMLLIIGAYNGWGDIVMYGEEIEHPGRAIPRALFGGIAGVAVLYLLVNAALLHVLTAPGMAGSDFAAADAAGRVFGSRGDTVLTAFGILSVGAITSLALMNATRLTYATARAGLLPHLLVKVGSRGTPIRAMLFVAILVVLFIGTGSYLQLASAAVAINQVCVLAVCLSAIALRLREPAMPRPFRAPLFPLTIALGLLLNVGLLAMFVVGDPLYSLSGFVLVGLFWGGYLLFARVSPRALPETKEPA